MVAAQASLRGPIGFGMSRWRLENRGHGFLDPHRIRGMELGSRTKSLLTVSTLAIAMIALLGRATLAVAMDSDDAAPSEQSSSKETKNDRRRNGNEDALLVGPMLRRQDGDLEMLLRGRVFNVDGTPAHEFELVAMLYKSQLGRDKLPANVVGNEFEIWVPIGGSDWFSLQLAATAKDGGSRAIMAIDNRELRQATLEGIDLRLAPTNRAVEISVTHNGAPVESAYVLAELSPSMLLQGQTDANGRLTFRLGEDEKLSQITAWTEDQRIGGFSFNRKPRRDPLGASFAIELEDCRDQTIRLLNAADNSPVANAPFNLIVATGQPHYNAVAVPATFPHCRLTTDQNGEATCRWFPSRQTHQAYVEMIDPRWATAAEDRIPKATGDGAIMLKLKRRVDRQPFVGVVSSDRLDVRGLLVEIKSFQGEEERRSDHLYAFSDETGKFSTACIPGATYTVCVNDGRIVSNMIDLIPYEPGVGKTNAAELQIREGSPVEVYVTSGPRREPMRNQWVYVRQMHEYEWLEDGQIQRGQGARDYPVYTDDDGVARVRALAGSKLRVTVYAGEWRSDERNITVEGDDATRIEIHRAIDAEREVTGRLLAPRDVDAELAGAEIVVGSIDGNTDEREAITADAQGRFAFRTKAIRLGIFAYTTDGKAAGVAKPESLDAPVEIRLYPTMDLHGQLLGKNDVPLVNHPVRVVPRVRGQSDLNKTFATSFQTKTFETKTDENGNYTLKNLPTELEMTVRADPIDGSNDERRLDDFYLIVGDNRPRMVSRLVRKDQPGDRMLSEKYDGHLRDAKLGGYHVLVLSYDAEQEDFVNAKLLDVDAIREVMSFLDLQTKANSWRNEADRKFAESKDWPQPTPGKVFVCALDATGKELGRIELDASHADSAADAAAFIRKHAPPPADAQAKWDAAFAEAKRSGRRVWAAIGQRYCGPCFRFSRWLDDNRELLERDYVLLKIDDVRDTHGVEIANRIASDRENFGVPFHTIFDANERLLIDSESPIGNIGCPSGFEGRRHLARMLRETRKNLSESDIEQIVATVQD